MTCENETIRGDENSAADGHAAASRTAIGISGVDG
jgi:hypothetical protein